jgi:hypothetical protein
MAHAATVVTRAFGVAVFVVIALVGVGLDVQSRRGTSGSPGLLHAVTWLEARRAGLVVLFIAWGFTGWHFFVR